MKKVVIIINGWYNYLLTESNGKSSNYRLVSNESIIIVHGCK